MRPTIKNLNMVWAIHRLESILSLLTGCNAKEVIREFLQVPGSLIQIALRDVRDRHTLIIVCLSELPDEAVEFEAQYRPARGPQWQATAD